MPAVAQRWPIRTVEERFVEKFSLDDETGCHVWMSHLDGSGYGRFSVSAERSSQLAHRIAYELFVGPIPEGMTIDHLCRNRRCVNPTHLEPVSLAENKRRGESPAAINARKTHCVAEGCTNQVEGHGNRKTCSDECRRERIRELVRAKS